MVTVGGLWGKTVIQLVSTIILARLLEPSDFGLVAIVMTVINFLDLFRDFGLTAAILQSKEVTPRQWSSLLWLSVALGIVFTAAVAASSGLVAHVFDDDRLVLITLVAAPTLLVNGLSVPLQAAVQRDLRFSTLAAIDVMAMLIGVILGTIAAFFGCGVWSLIVLAGSGLVYRLIALWVAARPHFGPPRIQRDILPMLSVGGNVLGTQVINYSVRNLDNVLIGQQYPAAVLGQYSRAYALFLLPLQQINGPLVRVALPVLSTLQSDGERFRRYIRAALLVIGYVTFPVYAISAAISDQFIRVLLGPGWSQAATVFALLSLAGIAQVVANVQGWIYISLGHTRRHMAYTAVWSIFVVASYVVGLAWNGIEGLALLYGLTTLALLIPGFWYAIRDTFVTGQDIVAPLIRPALIAPICFGAAWWASRAAGDAPAAVQLVLGGVAGLLVLVAAHVVPVIRHDTSSIIAFARQARRPVLPAADADPSS